MKAAVIAFTAGLMSAAVLGWFIVLAFLEVALLGRWHDHGLDRDEEGSA